METENVENSQNEQNKNGLFSNELGYLSFYLNHLEKCWGEHLHFKETKDKIVFFIGTLFITVLFGSSVLIYKSLDATTSDVSRIIYTRLYILQYVLMSLFFFLLYLYYTYNNIQEKLFLSESQCCQIKFNESFKDQKEYYNLIPVPYSLIKKRYNEVQKSKSKISGRSVKIWGNIILCIIYMLFSFIPYCFDHDFLLQGKGVTWKVVVNIPWILTGLGVLAIIGSIYRLGNKLIKKNEKEVYKRWGLKSNRTKKKRKTNS